MTARPGPRNLITDVEGVEVGCAHDPRVVTGVTVVTLPGIVPAAAVFPGGGPGTRETEVLKSRNLVAGLDALVFAGGSVYGLAAADAVTAALGAQGRGFRLREGPPPSPIVPAAVLYDLAGEGDKAWGEDPPYARLGREALAAAGPDFALGRSGAGYGARAGALRGGLGSASIRTEDGLTVGALAAVNSFGSVVAEDGETYFAAPWEIEGEFGGRGPAGLSAPPDAWPHAKTAPDPRANTTLCCVATDAALDPAELERVALMACAGLARAVRPVFAPFDGDAVFALSTQARPAPDPRTLSVARIGALAADVLARAVARGVHAARAA